MKLFRVLTLALSLTMLFAACKREAAIVANNNPLEQPTLGDQVKPLDQKLIEPKIRAFQALLEESKNGTSSRTITTIQAQELVDNIEMLLNYSHANAARTGADMVHKKDSFRLQNVNGLIDAQDVYAVYREVNNAVYDEYESVSDSDKNLFMVDVSLRTADDGSSWVDIDTYVVKGSDTSIYTFLDGWSEGRSEGKCNGELAGVTDAAKQLQYTINARYQNAWRYYYTNITSVGLRNPINQSDFTRNDNIRDYLIYKKYYGITSREPNYPESCILADDMSWYYTNIYNLITANRPTTDPRYQFASITIDFTYLTGLDYTSKLHYAFAKYGFPYGCTRCPVISPITKMP